MRAASLVRHWPEAVDGLVDGAVVAFAAWTLWYQVALAGQFDLRPSGWPFVIASLALMGFLAVRAAGALDAPEQPAGERPPGDPPARGSSGLRDALWLAGLVALVLAVILRDAVGVVPAAVLGILLVASAGWRRVTPVSRADDEEAAVGTAQHLGAALLSIGLGVLAAFLVKYDADDAFYVNRAAWVAEHGTAALNDTMFGPDTLSRASGTGLPTPSIEALQGVLAHLLGVEAGTLAYLVYTPVLAACVGWATWRLIRAWAPRRHLLVLAVAVLFVLASGASIVGNYSVGRIWQGKVTAYAVLLPLVWCYLTRLANRPSRRLLGLLAAAGVSFVGLTTTSALMSPVLLGAALVAAVLARSKVVALGGLLFAAAPVVNGVVQVLAPAEVGDGVTRAASARQVFDLVNGRSTAMATLAVVACVVAVLVVRRSTVAVVAAAGIVTLAVYVPGVITVADAATGAGPVVWRLALATPAWVFVGLLAAVPVGALERATGRIGGRPARPGLVAAALAAVLAVLVPVAAGTWLWSAQAGGRLASTPSWKVDPVALADVRAVQQHGAAPGRWLMPPAQMQALAVSTAGPFAVVPRVFYLPSLHISSAERADRETLFALVTGHPLRDPAAPAVRAALERLDVSVACVASWRVRAAHVLASAVGEPLAKVGSMRCHFEES